MLFFPPLIQRAAVVALALFCTLAGAADFRDPVDRSFLVWPNIPVIRASDLAEYEQDRKVFSDLHASKADPATVLAALQAVDRLQTHHERTTLTDLGRSLNVQVIGELDRQARNANTRSPKLRFEFSGITPQELQRASFLDAKALAALQAKASQITLVAYITYTRMEGTLVQATATLVKLGSGASQSFTVTAPVPLLGEMLARDVFDYFYGTRFPPHQNPLAAWEWLMSGPGHADQLVSRDMAQRYCQSQNAALPTAEELEVAEAAGFYGGGVVLRPQALYHTQSGLYDASGQQEGTKKTRPNYIASVRNGHYYCIRQKPALAITKARR